MAQVIVYTNENGHVTACFPTGVIPIEDVLVKDCPEGAIIIDGSELPEEDTYCNAWELVDGKVVVNETKKQAIIDARQAPIIAKQAAVAKLMALGLTEEEALALGGK